MYYGCDSNSDSYPCGSNRFYIGRMGGGITPGGTGWNQSASDAAGSYFTWGYWDIEGPNKVSATTTSQAYAWGQQQAKAAEDAWRNNTSILGQTIFGDVETGNPGWGTNLTLNQSVYLGFIEQLNADFSTSGIYSSPGNWSQIMGSSFSASPAKCVWSAAWLNGQCNSCPTSITGQGFGGFAPSIWQYNGNTGNGTPCPNDLDCAEALPD